MIRSPFYTLSLLILTGAVLVGCATVIPPEYESTEKGKVLSGPILALAGDGDMLIAANPDGIYTSMEGGEWVGLEVPGLPSQGRVSTLAVRGGEICVGTAGEGLYILRNGTWEVRTARYGGLPDDNVLSLAYDGADEGLPGSSLWVGTADGIAVRRMNTWSLHRPGEGWLVDLAGKSTGDTEKTYLGPGYELGTRGQDARYFKPPVTAIGVGPDRVVFGNGSSRIAVVGPFGAATINFKGNVKIISLLVDEAAIWAGTTGGLVWGGLYGVAEGTPWPAHRNIVRWTGRLFGARNSQPYQYRWHLVGYSTAMVPSLAMIDDSLWVAYGEYDDSQQLVQTEERGKDLKPIIDVRRFVGINEYIARKDPLVYESYGKNVGISGNPTVVLPQPDRGKLWVGTTKGLYRLER